MSETVKPRTYRSSVREEQARRTRLAILDVNSRLAPLHLVLRDAAAQDLAATGPVSR